MKSSANWLVHNKPGLLLAILGKLGGSVHLSVEGDLHGFDLDRIPGVSDKETAILKRNTIGPRQDFRVIPLESSMGHKLLSAISGAVPKRIIHIQIERDGVLQFGAYDNFDPECLFFGPALNQEFLDSLVRQEILKPVRVKT
jgi:hypothetical protein